MQANNKYGPTSTSRGSKVFQNEFRPSLKLKIGNLSNNGSNNDPNENKNEMYKSATERNGNVTVPMYNGMRQRGSLK